MQFLVISCLYVLIPMLSSKSDHSPSEKIRLARIPTSGPKCPDPSDSLWGPPWAPLAPPWYSPVFDAPKQKFVSLPPGARRPKYSSSSHFHRSVRIEEQTLPQRSSPPQYLLLHRVGPPRECPDLVSLNRSTCAPQRARSDHHPCSLFFRQTRRQ